MDKNIYSTPEPSFAAELRTVLDKRNILTACSKRKVLDALDNHIVNDEHAKSNDMRKKIIEELYTSEENFIKQLEILIKEFKKPAEDQNLAPLTVINSVFGNIEAIYNINNELLAQLKQSKGNIVSAFLKTAPFFKLYSVYAYNYRNIINILQILPKSYPKFHEFILRQESKPTINKLNSLLITPIQRIPRYILLLKELKNHTPDTVDLYAELEAAIKEISFIADHIDNLVKDQENVSRMIAIQRCLVGGKPNIVVPGRKLVKEGSVVKVMKNDKASLSRYLILLNDLALYCNDWKEPDALKCLKVLPLDKCSVSVAHHNREIFSLHYQSLTLTLSCRDADMSIEWINIFEKTINQYIEDLRSLRRKSSVHQRIHDTRLSKQSNITKLLSSRSVKSARKRKAENENLNQQDRSTGSPSKKVKSNYNAITDGTQQEVDGFANVNNKSSSKIRARRQVSERNRRSDKKSCVKLAREIMVDISNSVQRCLTESTNLLSISKCGGGGMS